MSNKLTLLIVTTALFPRSLPNQCILHLLVRHDPAHDIFIQEHRKAGYDPKRVSETSLHGAIFRTGGTVEYDSAFSSSTVADSTWEANKWDKTDEDFGSEDAQQALSSLRTVISVSEYLNPQTVHSSLANVVNAMANGFQVYRDALRAIHATVPFGLTNLNLEYICYVPSPRIESVETSVLDRIQSMRVNWQNATNAAVNGAGSARRVEQIQDVLDALDRLQTDAQDSREGRFRLSIIVNFLIRRTTLRGSHVLKRCKACI
ncbi:hypothetical protein QBC46DRAFT_434996 [Diplogelasinospora grovesii]|uniref:Uncharacterized protein n=1 Tax=Diplogelasinospora grovesii TaxID=303347 RepID=A0AAN6MWZ2_9PEZI|nr:hypothetical protein QBC46DRAFT_434996 [Diplogelasinospora grovesii]